MAESVHMVVPEELAGWICRQQGCSRGDCQQCRRQVCDEIARHAVRLARQVQRARLADVEVETYGTRLWRCMEYHWKRLSEMQTMAFAQLAARLEAGDLGYERSSANVLLEFTLAQALELRNQEAAMMFETDYIPFVTSIARRLGGPRAVDVFDNFTAELILPRADRSPRIAGYHGRTSLRSWLRAVVANLWVSRQRKREAVTLNVLPEPEVADPTATLDHRPCVQLLRPLFCQAVGRLEGEDRLLIKMLLIDEVPQKELAEGLGIHSGNLTRRKQRITAAVWQGVQQVALATNRQRQAEQCLQLVLAGDDQGLKQQLGEVLSRALNATAENKEDAL